MERLQGNALSTHFPAQNYTYDAPLKQAPNETKDKLLLSKLSLTLQKNSEIIRSMKLE